MRVVDVDAHFHEPRDWLKITDAKLDEELGAVHHMKEVMRDFYYSNPRLAALPEEEKPPGDAESLPLGFVEHLNITEERHPACQAESKAQPYYSAEGRLKFCDDHGIDVQMLNPTFIGHHYVTAVRQQRFELIPKIKMAWNTWAAEQVCGHTDRLMPSVQVDFSDVPGCIRELTRMRKLGSRSFMITDSIVGGTQLGGPIDGEVGKSLTHPDYDPIWAAAADLEMAPALHIGLSRECINPGWAHNGQASLVTYGVLNFTLGAQLGIQNTLGALALDGVFEKHPKLIWIVQECGISWLPGLLETLDQLTELPQADDGILRPHKYGSTYRLPLKPSEYIRRQVRVAPLVASQPLRPTMDLIPPEILCFASDFPHVEGTADAVSMCKRQISDMSEAVQRNFFGGVGELLGL